MNQQAHVSFAVTVIMAVTLWHTSPEKELPFQVSRNKHAYACVGTIFCFFSLSHTHILSFSLLHERFHTHTHTYFTLTQIHAIKHEKKYVHPHTFSPNEHVWMHARKLQENQRMDVSQSSRVHKHLSQALFHRHISDCRKVLTRVSHVLMFLCGRPITSSSIINNHFSYLSFSDDVESVSSSPLPDDVLSVVIMSLDRETNNLLYTSLVINSNFHPLIL